MEGNKVLTAHEDKAKAILDFYDGLIGSSSDWGQTIDLVELGIPSHNLDELDAPFSEEEVWKTITLLPSDKAPGLDGFTGRFYKAFWQV